MHKLIALLYFIFSLAGCDHGRTIVMRSTADGVDLIYSRIHVLGFSSLFDCIRSQSGHCHYGVFEHDCAATPACVKPLREFSIDADAQRGVADLPADFQLCVSAEPNPMTRDCLLAGAAPHHGTLASATR